MEIAQKTLQLYFILTILFLIFFTENCRSNEPSTSEATTFVSRTNQV